MKMFPLLEIELEKEKVNAGVIDLIKRNFRLGQHIVLFIPGFSWSI
jgi:hypothetical protein